MRWPRHRSGWTGSRRSPPGSHSGSVRPSAPPTPRTSPWASPAAAAISSAGLSAGQSIVSIVVYVVIAAAGVAAPLVVMVSLGDRAQGILENWKAWLALNNATVMAVLLLVFGVVLVGKGVAGT